MEVGARITGAEVAVVARGGEVRPLPLVAVDAAEVEALIENLAGIGLRLVVPGGVVVTGAPPIRKRA